MSRHTATHRAGTRLPWGAAGLLLVGAVLCSVGAAALSSNSNPEPQVAAAAAPSIQAIRPVAHVAQAPVPVRLRIPSIAVDTALQTLSLLPDGSLQVPSQWQVAGWYGGGVRPGNPGPAVIAGHVDSVSGPAVFFRLRELHAGDAVLVTRADRSVVRFVVDTIAQYHKDSFPDSDVYGPQPVPVLRLITCTGDFDWTTHNYLDNLVVSAHLG